jgi:hypothetical protein
VTGRWLLGAGATTILVTTLWGFLQQPYGTRDGQVVFVSTPESTATTEHPEQGRITVTRCDPTASGLRVQGHVDPTGGQVAVIVIPGDAGDPGLAVAAAAVANGSFAQNSAVGDFVVTLRWAKESSSFAVAEPGSSLSGRVVVGPTTRCPPPFPSSSK